MENEETIELSTKRENLSKEIKDKKSKIKEIEKLLNSDSSGKIDYTGKAVLLYNYCSEEYNNDKCIMIVNKCKKCEYDEEYLSLYGKQVILSKYNHLVRYILYEDGFRVKIKGKDKTYLYVMSDEEYNQLIMETCESFKQKFMK